MLTAGPRSSTVAPGGLIVIFLNGRHFIDLRYEDEIRRLDSVGRWQVDEISTFNYMAALDRPGRLIIATRT